MNDNEKVISVNELFLNALYHWKIIVLVTILCAVGLGGIGYYSNYKVWKIQYENSQEINEENGKKLNDSEIDYVDRVVKIYNSSLTTQESYRSSYLANMDYSKVNKTTLSYYIGGLSNDESMEVFLNDLSLAYQNYFQSSEFYYGASEVLDQVSPSEIKFLVSVKLVGHTIIIVVKGNDEADTKVLTEYVKNCMKNFSVELNSLVVHHTLSTRDEYSTVEMDWDISVNQSDYISDITNQKERVKEYIRHMNYEQVQLLESRLHSKVEELFDLSYESLGLSTMETPVTIAKPTFSKKYILAGIMLGGGISILAVSLLFLHGRCIVSPTDISRNYGIKIYGTYSYGKNKYLKHISKVYRGVKKIDNGIDYSLRIINQQAKERKRIIFASSIFTESQMDELLKNAKEVCDNISVSIIGKEKIVDDRGFDFVKNSDAVVLLEKYEETLKMQILDEIEMCKDFDKQIMGCIMFV